MGGVFSGCITLRLSLARSLSLSLSLFLLKILQFNSFHCPSVPRVFMCARPICFTFVRERSALRNLRPRSRTKGRYKLTFAQFAPHRQELERVYRCSRGTLTAYVLSNCNAYTVRFSRAERAFKRQ